MSRIPKFESKIGKLQEFGMKRCKSSETLNVDSQPPAPFILRNKQNAFNKQIPKPQSKLIHNLKLDKVPELPNIKKIPRANLRRSKSSSDLSTIAKTGIVNVPLTFKSKRTPPSNPKSSAIKSVKPGTSSSKINSTKPILKSTVLRNGVKRQGEISDAEVKNKIPKKENIPAWDIKGRLASLQEKHKTLQSNYKALQEKHEDLSANSETELSNLYKSQENLKEENKKLSQMYEDIHPKYQSCVSELSDLKEKYADVSNKYEKYSQMYEDIHKEYQSCVSELSDLKEKYADVSNKYEKCYNENQNLLKKQEVLLSEVYNGEKLRKKLHNCIQDLKGNIRVFCRVRPALTKYEETNQCNFNFPDINCLEISKMKDGGLTQEFTFDRVFDGSASQEEIFEDLSQLIQSAMDGYHVCVFAYGQTGSGKTYTMQGESTHKEASGMIPRSVRLLFQRKAEMERHGWVYKIEASFLEIYNENVRDLLNLNSKGGKSLDIRYNDGKGTSVSNLTIVSISSAEELMTYLQKSQQNRSTAVTNYNEHSSRSHAVTKIYIQARYQDSNEVYVGSVCLVDLAGSECAKSVSNERLAETKNINKSLSSLGNVLMALYKKESHIPYRNSKLTFLLQSSLGGNCKCLMIVNISPTNESYNESISALRFAAKVKEVKMASSKNKLITPSK